MQLSRLRRTTKERKVRTVVVVVAVAEKIRVSKIKDRSRTRGNQQRILKCFRKPLVLVLVWGDLFHHTKVGRLRALGVDKSDIGPRSAI